MVIWREKEDVWVVDPERRTVELRPCTWNLGSNEPAAAAVYRVENSGDCHLLRWGLPDFEPHVVCGGLCDGVAAPWGEKVLVVGRQCWLIDPQTPAQPRVVADPRRAFFRPARCRQLEILPQQPLWPAHEVLRRVRPRRVRRACTPITMTLRQENRLMNHSISNFLLSAFAALAVAVSAVVLAAGAEKPVSPRLRLKAGPLAMAFSPDGRLLAVVGTSTDPATFRPVRRTEPGSSGPARDRNHAANRPQRVGHGHGIANMAADGGTGGLAERGPPFFAGRTITGPGRRFSRRQRGPVRRRHRQDAARCSRPPRPRGEKTTGK